MRDYGITWEGVVYSAATGALLGIGYDVLSDEREAKIEKRAIGGATILLGLYLGSPTWLREIWFGSIRK